MNVKMEWKKDCKSFAKHGGFACDLIKSEGYKDCDECLFYEPYSEKILIINFGAKGNIIRTTPILRKIKKKHPNSYIIWLVSKENEDALIGNKYIDKVLTYSPESILRLNYEKFNIIYSLDTDGPGRMIANLTKADKKFGYYLDETGNTNTFNKGAKYYYEIALSDTLTKSNRKSFQEMIFEVIEEEFEGEEYVLEVKNKAYGEEFAKKNNIEGKVIGINIGSSPRWPAKAWSTNKITELIKKILKETDYKILILGGPHEIKKQREILDKFSSERVIGNNCSNTYEEFIGVTDLCGTIITGDTLTLHIAIGLKKKTIALFFCTPPWEIHDYNITKKITSPLLEKYIFTDLYNDELANSISAEEIFKEIK